MVEVSVVTGRGVRRVDTTGAGAGVMCNKVETATVTVKGVVLPVKSVVDVVIGVRTGVKGDIHDLGLGDVWEDTDKGVCSCLRG